MSSATDRTIAKATVVELVSRFERNRGDYIGATYNETQARTDFITPFLEAFGWDVHNTRGHSLALREVIEEATVEVGEERLAKKPDYELRLARQRKIFVEAKKPAVRIDRDRAAAFQTRRYGYSASLPVAILTNFCQLAVYDCVPKPAATDETIVARLALVNIEELETRFDDLWGILSREAVYSGDFDRRFAVGATRQGAEQFDDYFLRQVRAWRERLAADIYRNTPGLTPPQLTYVVQLFLSRIIFLRICEDRDIEKYEALRTLGPENTFASLMELLRHADAFYDSGLFRLLDDAPLGVRISDTVLRGIIDELYYPQSPYTFAVVETRVLGEIYEQFLGETIAVEDGAVRIIEKPEIRESGGVVPTPRHIADAIVARSLAPALADSTPDQLVGFTVADICCGSGTFLLSAFEILLDHYLTWYSTNRPGDHMGQTVYEAAGSQRRLTFAEKRRILLAHVRGVDVDPNAVEVCRFSLLLRLIEDESPESLRDYCDEYLAPALPSLDGVIRCGNSLVSHTEWTAALGQMPDSLLGKVNPFHWGREFGEEMSRGGFDVIVGNPPYIRIQNMKEYSPDEVGFYQSPRSPFVTARQDSFDKYALFIERSISLLRADGRLGVIVPHKFMSIQAGRALRRLIGLGRLLEEIVHFGVKQVFGPGTSSYTCILILDKRGRDAVRYEEPGPLEEWRYGRQGSVVTIPAADLGETPWQFADADTRAMFDRVRAASPTRLEGLAEILVGVQTSADPIFIFPAANETATTVTVRWDERDWPIERGILRPCLHDVPLRAFTRPQPNEWMIFPYRVVTGGARARAQLIQPAEMAQRYPGCWAYLNAHREELDQRDIQGGPSSGRQWYQFGRSQSLTKFDSPKIILPVLSIEARYAYDDTNIVVTGGGNGPYYMIRPKVSSQVSVEYLLAVLNHPMSEALVRKYTSQFRGGYYSHGKQFIADLPIPMPDAQQRAEVGALVTRIIDLLSRGGTARTPQERALMERQGFDLTQQVEQRISAAFGLSSSDMEIVRAVPIPS